MEPNPSLVSPDCSKSKNALAMHVTLHSLHGKTTVTKFLHARQPCVRKPGFRLRIHTYGRADTRPRRVCVDRRGSRPWNLPSNGFHSFFSTDANPATPLPPIYPTPLRFDSFDFQRKGTFATIPWKIL